MPEILSAIDIANKLTENAEEIETLAMKFSDASEGKKVETVFLAAMLLIAGNPIKPLSVDAMLQLICAVFNYMNGHVGSLITWDAETKAN